MSRISRAFTLVEVVVYASLVALLLIIIVEMTMSIAGSSKKSSAYLDVNSTAVAAFGRFSRDIRRATAVDDIASALDASSGRLVLQMKRADGSNDVTSMYLDGGVVKEGLNGSYVGDLTPDGIEVSNLTFRLFRLASTTAVRVEMTVAPEEKSEVPAVNFYGTYVLRGSYIQ
jgi:hypothetical protein